MCGTHYTVEKFTENHIFDLFVDRSWWHLWNLWNHTCPKNTAQRIAATTPFFDDQAEHADETALISRQTGRISNATLLTWCASVFVTSSQGFHDGVRLASRWNHHAAAAECFIKMALYMTQSLSTGQEVPSFINRVQRSLLPRKLYHAYNQENWIQRYFPG